METAKVFENGKSQTVQLPEKFRFSAEEVVVQQLGKAVILVPREDVWQPAIDGINGFTDDIFEGGRNQGLLEARTSRIQFDEDNMWVSLLDGRTLGIPKTWFPKLLSAAPEDLAAYEISEESTTIRWDSLDEDISVANLLLGYGSVVPPDESRCSSCEEHGLKHVVIHAGQQPTEAQIREIEVAASMPSVPDEDAPELTPEQYAEMSVIARGHCAEEVRPAVTSSISSKPSVEPKTAGKKPVIELTLNERRK